MKKLIIVLGLFLSGCSNYSFNSNLDKENFDEYFKPSQVKVYEKTDLTDKQYLFVATVEGESCQRDDRDPVATPADARTQARLAAADTGANGIIFNACITLTEDSICQASVVCYAKAIKVAEPE